MRPKKVSLFVSVPLLLLGTTFLTWSQTQDPPKRKALRENIHTLMLLRMTQALELTEDQTALIYPRLTRVELEKKGIREKIAVHVKELRALVREESVKSAELEEKMHEIKKLRDLLKDRDKEMEIFLEGQLTLIQRAKYLLFMQDFSKRLGERLQRARALADRERKKIERKS